MENEENRLSTFRIWPNHVPVDPVRIARAGFYATGNGLEVQCHWCQKKITSWEYGDQVMSKHRILNPICPFVNNPRLSVDQNNSIEIERTEAGGQGEIFEPEPNTMFNERKRLETYKNWSVPFLTPQSLAKAGLYYLNRTDHVKCAWCQGIIAHWEDGDNPFIEHQRLFPNCPRAKLGPNIEIASDGIRDLGIQELRAPHQERYSCLDARLRSFGAWAIEGIQPAEVLATAGFYYSGFEDQVRCFHCNGGLKSWQNEDDPWIEHAKWFPKCSFVQLVKGPQFIASVRQQMQTKSLNDAMITQPVQIALEMGLHEGRVRAVTKRKLMTTGHPYTDVEELVGSVLDHQHSEEDYGDDDTDVINQRSSNSSAIEGKLSSLFDTIFTPRASSSRCVATSSDQQPVFEVTANRAVTGHDTVQLNKDLTGRRFDTFSATEQMANKSTNESLEGNKKQPTVEPMILDKELSLEEENRQLKDARLCKVCMDKEVGIVFLPCGHLVTCFQCAPGVLICPLCRAAINGFVRTFLS